MKCLVYYKFDKPFYSQTQLLEKFGSVSESTLKRWMKEWIDKGNDLKDMGYFRIEKVRENQWCPVTFGEWLTQHKIENKYKYDYEKLEQDKLKKDINRILTNGETKNVKH